MKRTRRKNVWRGIRSSRNRFFSILFIVALGSGFMAGLAAASPDMYEAADRYMDEQVWYDADIKGTQGLSEENLEALRAMEETEQVVGARVIDLVLDGPGEDSLTSRVYAILDDRGESEMNRLVLKEGRMPQNASECVVQPTMGRYAAQSLQIGDVLTLSGENAQYEELRRSTASDTLTVVGLVESPMCISVTAEPSTAGSGRIILDVYTSEAYFASDYYTDAYITIRGAAALDTFGTEYEARMQAVRTKLEALGKKEAARRTEQLRNAAAQQLEQLRTVGKAAEESRQNGLRMSEDAAERLAQNAAVMQLLAQRDPVLAEILNDTQQRVAAGLASQNPDEAAAMLANLQSLLEKAAETVGELEEGSWVIQLREDASGYASYKSNVGKVAALAKLFPVFFFMVALLVALTTMTRLVEENRGQIGTLKALGFSNGQILSEYLLYSLLSSTLGCVLGFAVGFRLFPRAISAAYSMMYTLPAIQTPFRLSIALWVAPVTVGSILLATLWACWSEFRACPAKLMQPKAPAAGKRIWLEHLPFIWKHLSFTQKVTCRNLFRYKKRFFMTMIGVAGCSALLLTGFGLRDSINDIVEKQFGEIYRYQLTVLLREAGVIDGGLRTRLQEKESVEAWMLCAEEKGKAAHDGAREAVTLCVPADPKTEAETGELTAFISLRERKTGRAIAWPADGAVLTEKLCETLHLKVGDTVVLENAEGRQGTVRVAGITENYVASCAYLTPQSYQTAFGQEPAYAMLLCRTAAGGDSEKIMKELMAQESVLYVNSSDTLRDSFHDSIKSIDGVIFVLILAAGLLCMVVLYNLTNVNICERRKELATLRVLGFYPREVEEYIFRETDALSFLGALAGLGIGVWLHSFVVRTVEVDSIMFGRRIAPMSYGYALLISVIFTLLVNGIMRRTIRKVDMVEAMKAND